MYVMLLSKNTEPMEGRRVLDLERVVSVVTSVIIMSSANRRG